jgi:serine/threonine protein kinase
MTRLDWLIMFTGLPYDMMIDIWSFGCILAELFSGTTLCILGIVLCIPVSKISLSNFEMNDEHFV